MGIFNTNPTPITSGNAELYPSEISVGGSTSQQVIGVEVTLNGLSHQSPDNLDILLVGPQGQQSILMSDSGGLPDVVNQTLTFSNSATSTLPDNSAFSGGTFLPFNHGTGGPSDAFNAPGPGVLVNAPADLSVFNGTNPNGNWQLFVFDDAFFDTGNIQGWTLTLTLSTAAPDIIVTSSNDSGPGSLREAILDAPDSGLISFSPTVFNSDANKVITLSSPLSLENKAILIDASPVGGITLNGNGTTSQLFLNENGGSLSLDSLNLTGASSGAISNDSSTLTITNCAIYRNQGDSAISNLNTGTCAITNSTIAFHTGGSGAGFLSRGSNATLTHVTIANNASAVGISHESGSLTLEHCLLSNPDSTLTSSPDLGGSGGTIVATAPNFIRAIGGSYASEFPLGPLVGTVTSPVEALLVGDNLTDLNGDPLFNYGGPTLGLMPQVGSPVIDASPSLAGTDQRGVTASNNRDLGALETTWNNNTTTVMPAGLIADITIPTTAITNFPLELTQSIGSLPSLLNGQPSTVAPNTETNWALTFSPLGPEFSLSGVALTSSSLLSSGGSPTSFVLLGSNDLSTFEHLAAATLSPFTIFNERQTVFFSSPFPHFDHYRLVFPSSRNPASALLALGEIELLGTPLPPWSPLRITDTPTTTNNGVVTFNLTFDSVPGTTYEILNSSGLDGFTSATGSLLFSTPFTADSWNSTTDLGPISLPREFFRIQENIPEP